MRASFPFRVRCSPYDAKADRPVPACGRRPRRAGHRPPHEYQARYGAVANYGTDIEFATVGGRKYAFAGSCKNGMQIVDISDPWLLLRPRRSALATGRQAERPARQGGEHLLLVEDRPALIGPHP